jgi:hypothetical protein
MTRTRSNGLDLKTDPDTNECHVVDMERNGPSKGRARLPGLPKLPMRRVTNGRVSRSKSGSLSLEPDHPAATADARYR